MNALPKPETRSLYAAVDHSFGAGFRLQAEFTLHPGITILFGASGAGKTTLLDSLAGLTQPDSGRIVCGGRTLLDRDQKVNLPPQKRRCGYLFQSIALFPHFTARQYVVYGLYEL